MSIFGVIGKPISHSKSPNLMNLYFRLSRQTGFYLRLALNNIGELRKFFELLKLKGVNVTSPFKEDAFSFVDKVSEEAKWANAVNTIVVNESGESSGYNTDFSGVKYVFDRYNVSVKGKRAVVIGLGGAGKVCARVLKDEGGEVTVVNRTLEKARNFALQEGCSYAPIDYLEDVVKEVDIVISALPRGVDLIKEEWLRPGQVFMDANYGVSSLKNVAKEKGCVVVDSLYWLVGQSIPAFEIFTGRKINTDEVSFSEVLKGRDFDAIAIIGFMLSGKTAVGRVLADRLGWEFVDLDATIEARAGKKIRDIFEQDGEEKFRLAESEILRRTIGRKKVVSCGGGVVIQRENRELLKRKCFNIWLLCSVDEALKRKTSDDRPLLNVEDTRKRAYEIFKSRIEFYADVSDIVILNEGKNLSEVVERLYEEIRIALIS